MPGTMWAMPFLSMNNPLLCGLLLALMALARLYDSFQSREGHAGAKRETCIKMGLKRSTLCSMQTGLYIYIIYPILQKNTYIIYLR